MKQRIKENEKEEKKIRYYFPYFNSLLFYFLNCNNNILIKILVCMHIQTYPNRHTKKRILKYFIIESKLKRKIRVAIAVAAKIK